MERIRRLNGYQKSILILMMVMALIFAVVYAKTISSVGYRYNDAILVPMQENENMVYSGRMKGRKACFIVSDHTVIFQHGDKTYDIYTVKEDPSAIPSDNDMAERMTGVEILEGEEILFRGGIVNLGDFYWLCSEDGTSDNMIGVSFMTSDGIERDADGNPIDRMKPTASTLYELTHDPELTHKGEALAWFGAVLICMLNAGYILFADELFRFNLGFQIRHAERAEPSDWEIARRHIEWLALAMAAFVIFVLGLQ